jgi:hypothetical protein
MPAYSIQDRTLFWRVEIGVEADSDIQLLQTLNRDMDDVTNKDFALIRLAGSEQHAARSFDALAI